MAPYVGPTRTAAMSLAAEKVGEANGARLPIDYSESDAEALAGAALEWLLHGARSSGPALTWSGIPGDDEMDPTLYSGGAGIVLALLEGHAHFGEERYAEAAMRDGQGIAA